MGWRQARIGKCEARPGRKLGPPFGEPLVPLKQRGAFWRQREISEHCAEMQALLGDDWFPYGLKRNYKPLDTFLRYHYEQGLSKRRFKPEELFLPETLDD